MPLPVALKLVAEALEALPSECTAYINSKTGDVETISNEREWDDVDEVDTLPEWMREEKARSDAVLECEDFIKMPDSFEIHDYQILREFAETFPHGSVGRALSRTLRGSGAFRRFKSEIRAHGVEQQWYDFKSNAIRKIAVKFLEESGIPFIED